jgi:hypothetical protein
MLDRRFAVAAALLCTGVLFTCIETSAQSVPRSSPPASRSTRSRRRWGEPLEAWCAQPGW